jgi:hypothetical protein
MSRAVVLRLTAAVLAGFLTFVATAPGLAESEIRRGPRHDPRPKHVALVMTGMIGPGAYKKFRRTLDRSRPDIVILDGPGGVLGEAILIAEEVRRRGLKTAIAANGRCASACAIVFLAGRTKQMGEGAAVGLHSASFEDGRADPLATGIMAGYLSQLGVPASTLHRMASTAPSDIRWLTRSEQRALRIRKLD